jgi:tetratricopeptide (TPR) repeat protein
VFLFLAATIGIVYSTAVDGPFFYDDSTSVLYNPSIVRLFPLVGTDAAPGPLNPPRDISTSGRPLVNLSLAVNYHFGQFNPRGYHVTNVVIHAIAAFLLWAIVRWTLRLPYFEGRFSNRVADWLALCVALLWSVHPMQTEAVQYVTQRTELMMACGYLVTLYASLRYWDAMATPQRRIWLGVAILACSAGMACKEVMVTAPVVVLLFERVFIAGSFRRAIERSWPLYVGLVLGWLLLVGLNLAGPRAATAGLGLGVPIYQWWLTQFEVLFLYVKLAVWPWPLSIHYEMPLIETFSVAWPWMIGAAGVGVVVAWLLYQRTAVGFLLASVLLILSPTFVVPIATEVAAERRMYLPLAGLMALAVVGAYGVARRVQQIISGETATLTTQALSLTATLFVALALATGYAVASVHRLNIYRDEVSLWQDALRSAPDSPLVRMNLGLALINAGLPQQAIEHYEAALRLEPEKGATHRNNLALALLSSGRRAEAIAQYEEALRIDPELVEAHNNLGSLLLGEGKAAEAVAHFTAVTQLKPDYAEGYLGLAMALSAAGRPDAAAAGERALALAREQGNAALAKQVTDWLSAFRASAPKN